MLKIMIINCDDKFVEYEWNSIADFLKDMQSDKENIPMLDDTVIAVDTEDESYTEEECRLNGIHEVDDVVEWCRHKENVLSKMQDILTNLMNQYGLQVIYIDNEHICASNDMITCLMVAPPPHSGAKSRWMIRFSTVAAFNRLANSYAIEEYFKTAADMIVYLQKNESDIYRKLIDGESES